MRISDWSSDVCSSDLLGHMPGYVAGEPHKVHFDQHAFLVHSEDGNDWTKVQGVRFDLEYDRSKAAPKLSNIEIQENYLNQLKQLGASLLDTDADEETEIVAGHDAHAQAIWGDIHRTEGAT